MYRRANTFYSNLNVASLEGQTLLPPTQLQTAICGHGQKTAYLSSSSGAGIIDEWIEVLIGVGIDAESILECCIDPLGCF